MIVKLRRRFRSRRTWIAAAAALMLLGLLAPHAWAYHQLRSGYSELGRYHPAAAREHFEACLRIWPEYATAQLLAGRAARESGDFKGAGLYLRLCQRRTGPTDQTAFEWALLQAAAGNVGEVESYLQQQADRNPASGHLVWEALADGYLRMFRNNDAMNCANHWLANDPDNVRALELRGRAYVAGKGVKRGSDDYRRVLELDPTRDETRTRFTQALVDLGAYDEAVPHLEILERSRPDDAEVPVRLARCLYMQNRKNEARDKLNRVLARHPDDGMALRTLGQFALSENQRGEAEVWLRRAAAALPANYQTQFLFYESLRQQGKPEAAAQLKVAEAARENNERLAELQSRKLAEQPLDPALHVEMAALLMRAGHKELAVRWLQSTLVLDPGFRPAHAALADFYAAEGRTDLAEQHRRLAREE